MQPSLMIFLVLQKTLHCLHVPVTKERLRNLISEQLYHGSLRTIKEVLSDLNIESQAYQFEQEDINIIECPIIVHFKDLYNKFVVVVDIQEDHIKYYDPITNNYIIEKMSLFFEKWTGTVLIPFTDEQSGDPDYSKHLKEEREKKNVNIWIFMGISMGFIILLVQTIISHPLNWMLWLSIFAIKIIALTVVSQIVKIELGESNTLIANICKTTDCNNVLNSKASKLFSWLTMGDMGMIYFGSGTFLLIMASFLNDITSIVCLLFFLNLFTLPYTLFSVSYQRFVLKSWCPFCLTVMGLLWTEFFLGLTVDWTVVFPLSIHLLLLVGFTGIIITVCWLVLKKILYAIVTANSLKLYTNKIKKDTKLFNAFLSTQNSIPEFTSSSEIFLGNENAKNIFIAVISMNCHACVDLYRSIQRFLMFHSEELKVILRFKPSGLDNQVIDYILTCNINNMKEMALKILEDWYNIENRDFNKWKKKFDLDNMVVSNDAIQLRNDYLNWLLSFDISGMPVMILNNKPVPFYYTFDDVIYLLKKM